jgi:hypothetical protein
MPRRVWTWSKGATRQQPERTFAEIASLSVDGMLDDMALHLTDALENDARPLPKDTQVVCRAILASFAAAKTHEAKFAAFEPLKPLADAKKWCDLASVLEVPQLSRQTSASAVADKKDEDVDDWHVVDAADDSNNNATAATAASVAALALGDRAASNRCSHCGYCVCACY